MSSYMPNFRVSSVIYNLILLSLVELNNSIHRCLTVVKARGCEHSFDSREYTIGEGGIKLLPVEESTVAALPIIPLNANKAAGM